MHMELGDQAHGNETHFPVFARINYPDNKRLSHPIAARINRLFGTRWPEDTPIDVVAAFLGNPMTSVETIRADLDEFLDSYEKQATSHVSDLKANSDKRIAESDAISAVAHLAVLRDPNYQTVFERISAYPNPMMRIAGLKGAAELGMRQQIEHLMEQETDSDVLQVCKSILEKWDSSPQPNTLDSLLDEGDL